MKREYTSIFILVCVAVVAYLAGAREIGFISGLVALITYFAIHMEKKIDATFQVVVKSANHHVNTSVTTMVQDIPKIAKHVGQAFAETLTPSVAPYATLGAQVSRNKIGILASIYSLWNAETTKAIVAEGVKLSSMIGFEAMALGSIAKVFSSKEAIEEVEETLTPEDKEVLQKESATDFIPLATTLMAMGGVEMGDNHIYNLLDKSQRSIVASEKLVTHFTKVAQQAGLLADSNMDQLTKISIDVNACRSEHQWILDSLAVDGNIFNKQEGQQRLATQKARIEKADEELKVLSNVAPNLKSTQMWSQVNYMIQKNYDMFTQIAAIQKNARERIVPVGVCIYGESQIGKSECANVLIDMVKEELIARQDSHHYKRVKQWQTWRCQVRDEFDTGYVGQEVTYQDDAFAGKDNEDHAKWLNFISPHPVGTVQAKLEAKGCPYQSVLVVTSCNNLPEKSITINNISALHGRFPFTIQAKVKSGRVVPATETMDRSFDHLEFRVGPMGQMIDKPGFEVIDLREVVKRIVTEMIRREAYFEAKLRAEVLERAELRQESKGDKPKSKTELSEEQRREFEEKIKELESKQSSSVSDMLASASKVKPLEVTKTIIEQSTGAHLVNTIKTLPVVSTAAAAAVAKPRWFSRWWWKSKIPPSEELDETVELTEAEIERLIDLAVKKETRIHKENLAKHKWRSWSIFKPKSFSAGLEKELPRTVKHSIDNYKLFKKLNVTYSRRLGHDLQLAKDTPVVNNARELGSWVKILKLEGEPVPEEILDGPIKNFIFLLPKMEVSDPVLFAQAWASQPIVRLKIGNKTYYWGPRLWNGSRLWVENEETDMLAKGLLTETTLLSRFEERSIMYTRLVGSIACGLASMPFTGAIGAFTGTMVGFMLLRHPDLQFRPMRGPAGNLDYVAILDNVAGAPVRLVSVGMRKASQLLTDMVGLVLEKAHAMVIELLRLFGFKYNVEMESWLQTAGRGVIDLVVIVLVGLVGLLMWKLYRFWQSKRKNDEPEILQLESGRAGMTRAGRVTTRKGKIVKLRMESSNHQAEVVSALSGSVECVVTEIPDELLGVASNLQSLQHTKTQHTGLEGEKEECISFYWSRYYGWEKEEPDFKQDYNKMVWDAHKVPSTPRGIYPSPNKANNKTTVSSKTHYTLKGSRGRSLVIEIRACGKEEEAQEYLESQISLINRHIPMRDLSGTWESTSWAHPDTGEAYWDIDFYAYCSIGVDKNDGQEKIFTRKMLQPLEELKRVISGIDAEFKPKDVVANLAKKEVLQVESAAEIPRVAERVTRRVFCPETNQRAYGLAHLDWIIVNAHVGHEGHYVHIYTNPKGAEFSLGIVKHRDEERDLAFVKMLKNTEAVKVLLGSKFITDLDPRGYPTAPDLSRKLLTRDKIEKKNNSHVYVRLPTSQVVLPGVMTLTGKQERIFEDVGAVQRDFMCITGISFTTDTRISQKGDCGGPVFVRDREQDWNIIGLHAASSGSRTFASILSIDDLPLTSESETDDFEDLISAGRPLHMPPGGAVTFIGRYNGSNLPMSGTKSKWRKSPWYNEFEEVLVPPPLMASDPRIEVELPTNADGTLSLVMNQEKFLAEEIPKMDQGILDYAIGAKVVEMASNISINRTEGTLDDIIDVGLNGHETNRLVTSLNTKASAGLPWVDTPGMVRKEDHIEKLSNGRLFFKHSSPVKNRVKDILMRAKQGKRSIILVGAKLKDQLIKKVHVANGKVRVFHCVPIEKIVADAALFGNFKEGFLALGLDAQHAVGINPHSTAWEAIADHLSEHPNMFDCDFSQYDKRLHAEVMRAAFQVIRVVIQRVAPDEWDEAREVLADMSIETLIVDYNTIYRTTRGNKSGEYLTTVINSIVNDFYSYYCWEKLTGLRDWYAFRSNVRTVSFGDDKIESVSNKYADVYNYEGCANVLREIGHVITPGGKTGESTAHSLEDLEFLKRRFVRHGRWTYAPLQRTSIESSLVWTQIPDYELSIWYGLIAEHLYEAVLHGKEYYDSFVERLRRGESPALVKHITDLLNRPFEEVYKAYGRRYVTGDYGIKDFEAFH